MLVEPEGQAWEGFQKWHAASAFLHVAISFTVRILQEPPQGFSWHVQREVREAVPWRQLATKPLFAQTHCVGSHTATSLTSKHESLTRTHGGPLHYNLSHITTASHILRLKLCNNYFMHCGGQRCTGSDKSHPQFLKMRGRWCLNTVSRIL